MRAQKRLPVREAFQSVEKHMLPSKNDRAAGEREGAKAPLVIRLIAIKKVADFFATLKGFPSGSL